MRARLGSALLDVVVALVVLSLSGVGLITVVGQTSHSMRSVRNTEREIRRASMELDRFAAYDRDRIVSLTGRTISHGWSISVTRAAPALFDVTVARSDTSAPLLHTTLYRPDTTNVDR